MVAVSGDLAHGVSSPVSKYYCRHTKKVVLKLNSIYLVSFIGLSIVILGILKLCGCNFPESVFIVCLSFSGFLFSLESILGDLQETKKAEGKEINISFLRKLILLFAIFSIILLPFIIKAIIIGEGPEAKNLKRLVQKLGLENNIKFLGFLENIDNVYALIKSFNQDLKAGRTTPPRRKEKPLK